MPSTPGYNDPNDTATAVVNRLLADQALLQEQHDSHEAIARFLNALAGWKETAAQGAGKPGFVLTPPPIPPAGYVLPAEPPKPEPAHPGTVINEGQGDGRYPSSDLDPNADGKVIDNPFVPGGKLVKKSARFGGFGWSYWWEVTK